MDLWGRVKIKTHLHHTNACDCWWLNNLSEPQFTFRENEDGQVCASCCHRNQAKRWGGKMLSTEPEIFKAFNKIWLFLVQFVLNRDFLPCTSTISVGISKYWRPVKKPPGPVLIDLCLDSQNNTTSLRRDTDLNLQTVTELGRSRCRYEARSSWLWNLCSFHNLSCFPKTQQWE